MAKSQKPDTPATSTRYDAYQVQEAASDGGKSFWTRIGSAWPHTDGKGINVVLQALPIDGKVVLRLHEPKPEDTDT